MDTIQLLEDLIVIYERANDKKNVERSNDEIDKVIDATDNEISSVKDFLTCSSRKPSSTVPDKHVQAKQQELPPHVENPEASSKSLLIGNSNELNYRHFLVTRQSSNTFGLCSRVSWTILTSQRNTK